MNQVIIGKRIPIGVAVGGVVGFCAWLWNATHPALQVPAEVAVGLSAALTMIVQVVVVNFFGVTTKPE